MVSLSFAAHQLSEVPRRIQPKPMCHQPTCTHDIYDSYLGAPSVSSHRDGHAAQKILPAFFGVLYDLGKENGTCTCSPDWLRLRKLSQWFQKAS